jgi:gamma-glutamylcyclotransferase (GGCT)/AIG2-like uncharacterized protein YtfP
MQRLKHTSAKCNEALPWCPVVNLLFVYGTLRSQFTNDYAVLLRAQAELVGPASVRGAIYRVGHYPAWKPAPAGEVWGELYLLREPERTLQELDAYEGSEFERVLVNCPEPAWIYRYNLPTLESSRIQSGDFCSQ